MLPNGKVLAAGGTAAAFNPIQQGSAELYDLATIAWTLTGELVTPRLTHTTTLLANGKALLTGGSNSGSGAAAAVDAFTGAAAPFSPTRANGEPNIISFFGTGLGADATDVDGNVNGTVQAKIDGAVVTTLYAGRAPGFVGLNQLNILLPAGIASGTHTVVISRNGVVSNAVTIAVR